LPYQILYAPEAVDHLRAFTARDRKLIADTVVQQLAYEPTVPTRNRKPMRENPIAPWELRIDCFRVYFDVEEGETPAVHVRAVGVKDRDKVRIGGEIFDL